MALKLAYRNPSAYLRTAGLEDFVEPDVECWVDNASGVDRVSGKRAPTSFKGVSNGPPVIDFVTPFGGVKLVEFRGDLYSDFIELNYATALPKISYIIPFYWTSLSGSTQFPRLVDKGNEDQLYHNQGASCMTWTRSFSGTIGTWSWPRPAQNEVVLMSASQELLSVPIVYYNGIPQTVTTDSTPSGVLAEDSTSKYWLGNRSIDAIRVWQGFIGDLVLLPRTLSVKEHRQVGADFWYFMRRNKQAQYMSITVTPPAGGRTTDFWHTFV